MELREFIEARLTEEARDANLISSGSYEPQRWRLGAGTIGSGEAEAELTIGDDHDTDRYVPVRAVDRTIGGGPDDDEDSGVVAWVRDGRNEHLHMVRYDPARVLRDVEAKRRLLAQHQAVCDEVRSPKSAEHRMNARARQFALDEVLATLALSYVDHPDYDPSWSPEAT